MLAVCSRVGALGRILRENPELRAATLPAVRSALAAYDGPDGVRLNAATWVVTARAPAGRYAQEVGRRSAESKKDGFDRDRNPCASAVCRNRQPGPAREVGSCLG